MIDITPLYLKSYAQVGISVIQGMRYGKTMLMNIGETVDLILASLREELRR